MNKVKGLVRKCFAKNLRSTINNEETYYNTTTHLYTFIEDGGVDITVQLKPTQ